MKRLAMVLLVLLPFISTATSVQAHWRGHRPHGSWRVHRYDHSHHRYHYKAGHKAFWGGLAGGLLGFFLVELLTSPPTWQEAREEPQERCDWYYDSEGRWRWHCQGSQWRTRDYGPPVMPIPPAQLPPSDSTSTYLTLNPAPRAQLPVRQEKVSRLSRRKEYDYPPARVIADCKRTPEHPACQEW